VTLLASVAVPHAASRYAGETFIALFVPLLRFMRVALLPITKVSHGIDALFRRASGGEQSDPQQLNEELGEEILSVVHQGQKQGLVDPHERAMIESVIRFRDTTAGQIMTARTEMVTIELPAALDEVRQTVEDSGHSRVPAFRKSLDGGIVGVLYARDLLRYVGRPADPSAPFDLTTLLRPALFVPETTPLRDLLQDFRIKKVHLAIVLDEYGGTAGLVTIEDILEELVGDIRDEHEPTEPAQIQRVDDHTWEADARAYLDDLNAVTGLSLPDDAGYDTLGGFVTTSLSRIPAAGTAFEQAGVRYVVLGAEPQRVTRVRIELPAAHATESASG
jgi:CBS domain containing-hemolysin-like protein